MARLPRKMHRSVPSVAKQTSSSETCGHVGHANAAQQQAGGAAGPLKPTRTTIAKIRGAILLSILDYSRTAVRNRVLGTIFFEYFNLVQWSSGYDFETPPELI